MKIRSYASPSIKFQPRLKLPADIPSLTQQHFAADADINNIVARYMRTGILVDPLQVSKIQPKFGDFSDQPSLMEMQNFMAEAKAAFMTLPSKIRAMFGNDPAALAAWLDDPSNTEQAIALGLLHNTKEQENGQNANVLDKKLTKEAPPVPGEALEQTA